MQQFLHGLVKRQVRQLGERKAADFVGLPRAAAHGSDPDNSRNSSIHVLEYTSTYTPAQRSANSLHIIELLPYHVSINKKLTTQLAEGQRRGRTAVERDVLGGTQAGVYRV